VPSHVSLLPILLGRDEIATSSRRAAAIGLQGYVSIRIAKPPIPDTYDEADGGMPECHFRTLKLTVSYSVLSVILASSVFADTEPTS